MPNFLPEDFENEVTGDIEAQHPDTGKRLSYSDYLQLSSDTRSGDEKPFVDTTFTPRLLKWLGYEESDWTYNETSDGSRPDFVVRPNQSSEVGFIVEDKNTTEEFESSDVEQIEKYTSGTKGYAIWTNSKSIIALRFYPGGDYERIADIELFTGQKHIERDPSSDFSLLKTLLQKNRFEELPRMLEHISMDEEEWEKQARPIDSADAHGHFMSEMKGVLDELTLAAQVRVSQALEDFEQAKKELRQTRDRLSDHVDSLLQKLSALPAETQEELREALEAELSSPLNCSEEGLRSLKPEEIDSTSHTAREWDIEIEKIISLVSEYRESEVRRSKSRSIHNSFNVWKNRFKIIENESDREVSKRVEAYSEQVAYTFFVRVLLGRILEDKGAIRRIISDGGIKRWKNVIGSNSDKRDDIDLQGKSLLNILFQNISRFYKHFFDQPIFDWFEPDDYLIAQVLRRLSGFSFENIDRDILGSTYENYVDRSFRGKKGHFLTREGVVSYILDEIDYEGREQIVGSSLLDPASGSGSFLVQASRRLRDALKEGIKQISDSEEEMRERLAKKYISEVQQNYVGFEINPFSCYLSELNLLLQILDDILYLYNKHDEDVSISGFKIYNTNSLILERSVMRDDPELGDGGVGLARDEARAPKMDGPGSFDFVVMNPPYVNKGKQEGALNLTEIPFYSSLFGGGDTNYYHAFIRLANHFVNEDGRVGLICPLQLFGDRSTGTIRRWLSAPTSGSAPNGFDDEWRILSLTRFHDRTVLFPGVTQAVCVAVWERDESSSCPLNVKVSGGITIDDVSDGSASFSSTRVIAGDLKSAVSNDPNRSLSNFSGEWTNEWTVISDEAYLNAWEKIRSGADCDLLYWQHGSQGDRLRFSQGDVNQTRTKPLRPVSQGGEVEGNLNASVPLCKSRHTDPFGPYEATRELDAQADVDQMGISQSKKRNAKRERDERVKRIHNLGATEAVCAIKAISGIEAARPLRGALYHRGGSHPSVCFDHSLQVIVAQDPQHSSLTEAAFGLLVSSVTNFVFGLLSTNQNVGRYEIMRSLVPDISQKEKGKLVRLARKVQSSGEDYWSQKHNYGCDKNIMKTEPDPWVVLEQSNSQKEKIEDARIKEHLSFEGRDKWHIKTHMSKGMVSTGKNGSYKDSCSILLKNIEENPDEAGDIEIPSPSGSSTYLSEYENIESDIESKRSELCKSLAQLDGHVLDLFGIKDDSLRELVGKGMPWSTVETEFAEAVVDRL